MEFYHIADAYIAYLRQFDSKIYYNKHETRPYVGVLIAIDDIEYYAPFTSPKSKHLHMKNDKDFRKIAGGQYGAINFNNMIPVPRSALILMDIGGEPDVQYRRLLQNQYNAIKADYDNILRTAASLRCLILKDDGELSERDKAIKARCCNLRLIESVFRNYK